VDEDPALRSRTMRAVRSRDTGPELKVRQLVHRLGYRFRLHRRDLPGCPDLVFASRRRIIFVHGCFWHGHGCRRGARVPKTNRPYWVRKIARNVARDDVNLKRLKGDGWKVLVIWECKTRDTGRLVKRIGRFLGMRGRDGKSARP
jgi:DNA mismatch endonuclease (patch repair protein)